MLTPIPRKEQPSIPAPISDEVMQQLVAIYQSGTLQATQDKVDELFKQYPSHYMLFNFVGAVEANGGKIREAVGYYQKALQLNPNFAETHNNFGNALSIAKNPQQAVAGYHFAQSPGY